MSILRFSKMHGIGNDFVIIDQRTDPFELSPECCRLIADRRLGVGCDQIIGIHPAKHSNADAAYRIWNSDGSQARQCGNGARCVASWLLRDGCVDQGKTMHLESPAGVHRAECLPDGRVRISMGVPEFTPRNIPLLGFADMQDSYALDLPGFAPVTFGAVSMGNPHAVIEVEDAAGMQIEALARAIQADAHFPDSVNVGFAQVVSAEEVRLRVYERGVGETLACGSGACAAAVVLMEHGRVGRSVTVRLPGGELQIEWPTHGQPVMMTGPTAFVFEGEFDFEGIGQ